MRILSCPSAEPTQIKRKIQNALKRSAEVVANSITIGRHQDPFAKLRRGMSRDAFDKENHTLNRSGNIACTIGGHAR